MQDPDVLQVWYEQRQVGQLWRHSSGTLGFRYDSAWIQNGGFAVSHSLPLTTAEFPPETGLAHRWFANLLPEGSVREHIVRDLKLPDTDFDLLRAIGGDCAGALSILPEDRQPSTQRQYRRLSETDLIQLVRRRGQIYTDPSAGEPPRLSLAGAQNKCPVLLQEGQYYLPQEEAPSSHILKFELVDYRHLPAYETFTTRLAEAVGLPTVAIELRSIAGIHYAEIVRYDRFRDEHGEWQRWHQEDFCQALGYGHAHKYQEHGGPSFAQCYRLVQEVSTEPAYDGEALLRWQVFNVLAGNSDGHAKNLSLLHRPDGTVRLAPFYDLVSTRAIARIDPNLAFAVGKQRNPQRIQATDWDGLARACGVRPRFLAHIVEQTATALLDRLDATREAFEVRYGPYPALQRIERVVAQQCRRALQR